MVLEMLEKTTDELMEEFFGKYLEDESELEVVPDACPFCNGGGSPVVYHGEQTYYVSCEICGFCTPHVHTDSSDLEGMEQAVLSWNKICKKLKPKRKKK